MKRIKREGVAAEIHDRRRALKWSASALAAATGGTVSEQTIYFLELGKTQPHRATLQTIRQALERGEELARLTGAPADPTVAADGLPEI